MSEPSRPPPPKAYTPSRPKEDDLNLLIDFGTEPPIPPRPPPEAIPKDLDDLDLSMPQRPQNSKRGTGPPPPPAPYGKKEQNTQDSSTVTKSLPPKRVPPPSRPVKPSTGPSRPSQPPVTSPTSSLPPRRNSKEITVVSAQPMNSDVVPPPSLKPDQDLSKGLTEKKAPPPKRGPPPSKPPKMSTSQNGQPQQPEQTTPCSNDKPPVEKTTDSFPPPPSYPAPPPPPTDSTPSEEQYPPKPTSPPPPLPMERVKKPSVSNRPSLPVRKVSDNPVDSVVAIGGVASAQTKEPSSGEEQIDAKNTQSETGGSKPKPMPQYATVNKPKPPPTSFQFGTIGQDNGNRPTPPATDSTSAETTPTSTNDNKSDSSKPVPPPGSDKKPVTGTRPKPPPARKGPPPVTTKLDTSSSKESDVSSGEGEGSRKTPPTRKGPPPVTSVKGSPPTNKPSSSPSKSRPPPPKRGAPPPSVPPAKEPEKKPSPKVTHKEQQQDVSKPAPVTKGSPSSTKPGKNEDNNTENTVTSRRESPKPKRSAPRPPPPTSSIKKSPSPTEDKPKAPYRTRPISGILETTMVTTEEVSETESKTSIPSTEEVLQTESKTSIQSTEEVSQTESKTSIPSTGSGSPGQPAHKSPPVKPVGPSKPAPPKPGPPKPGPPKPDKSPPVKPDKSPPVKPSQPSIAPRKTAPAKPGPPKPGPSKPGPPKPGPPTKSGPPRPDSGPPPKPGPPKPGPPKHKNPAPSKPPSSGRPTPATRNAPQDTPPSLPPRPTPGHPLYRYVCSEPHGLAINNSEAEEADELSYMEGDVIELIEKIDDYWYWARNADNEGAEGLIVATDMKIVKRLPGADKVAALDGPCAVAMNPFEAMQDDEISFKKNDLIMLIARIGNGEWLRGRTVDGKEGIFPASFVEIVDDLPPDAVESPPGMASPEIPDGPYCVAIETFNGETPDDLSFKQGDVITLTERIDDSWLRGTIDGGQSGMFPQVFVDVRVDLPVGVVKSPSKKEDTGNKKEDKKGDAEASISVEVEALYDFEGQSEEELTFKAGDKIVVTHRVNDEWIYGSLGWSKGMFPSSFIDKVPDNLPMKKEESKEAEKEDTGETKSTTPTITTGKCEALYDFEAANEGELTFKAGEVIVTTEWINDEWISGKIGSDREGMFPLDFVKVIDPLPKETSKDTVTSNTGTSTTKQSSGTSKKGTSDDLLPKGVATSNFNPADSSEIAVKAGDEVYLLSRETNKMYLGENLRTGDLGNFPINIIDVVIPLP